MTKKQEQKLFILVIIGAFCVLLYSFIIPFFTRDVYEPLVVKSEEVTPTLTPDVLGDIREPEVIHIPTPTPVRSVYMTSCAAATPSFRQHLTKLIDETELNAIVIDIKDYTGRLSYIPDEPSLQPFLSNRCYAADMKAFIKTLHEKNIYVIGRVTVFQDPYFSTLHPEFAVKRASDGEIWKDKKGLSYLDPGSQAAWDHTVAIATSSYAIGFDEINFDYIRFPSDGNMSDISFPYSNGKSKQVVLESFFSYLHDKMTEAGIVTSADLFGMTTTNVDDLNIGQVLERTLPYFDYVAPMVYPSHYPPRFNGWPNPNLVVYDLIHFVMKRGVERTVATTTVVETFSGERIGTSTPALYTKPAWSKYKLRPWIQDFDYGGNYGPKEVRDQIQATYDVGLDSWMLWDPANRYTREALLDEPIASSTSSGI